MVCYLKEIIGCVASGSLMRIIYRLVVLSFAYLCKAVAMLVNVNNVQKSRLVSNEPTTATISAMITSI